MQAENPVKSIIQDMKKNLELNQNFFLSENVDHKQKLFQKRQLKSIVVTRTTVLQMKLMLKR